MRCSSLSRLTHLLVLVGLTLIGCASPPDLASEKSVVSSTETDQANFKTEAAKDSESAEAVADAVTTPNAPRVRTQLIKTAALALEVEAVDTAIEALTEMLERQRGDVLSLNYEQPDADKVAEFVSLQVRVPQENLESTLKKFSTLGTVTRQTITAEDVSDQLVDLGARLRNLRQAEESVLKILDRTGSISEVLAVQQELQRIRQEIEQIDARRNDLQNRVAYSLIDIELDAIAPIVGTRTPLGEQFEQTWQVATRSLQDFTVVMLRLLLWLLIWSPYWGAVFVGVFLARKWRKKQKQPTNPD
ncbi:MAG: DUF4349 domain-containing protein [Spirulina sp. SIO3F2]|nr:DUF4349 domain-containing protein [Spirulina sp. SIO3F2]